MVTARATRSTLYLAFMLATDYAKLIAQLPDGVPLPPREAAIMLFLTLLQCLVQARSERKP